MVYAIQLLYLSLLYSSLAAQLWVSNPLLVQTLMAIVILCWFPRRPLALYGATWLVTNLLLGPPFFLLFAGFFNETNYLNNLNSEREDGWAWTVVAGLVGMLVCLVGSRYSRVAPTSPEDPEPRTYKLYLCRALALGLMINFIPRVMSLTPILDGLSIVPAAGSYSFDGQAHLKAFYLYREGMSYRDAYRVASSEDARVYFTDEAEVYRSGKGGLSVGIPVLFEVWKPLPQVSDLAILYWILIICLMGWAYRTFEGHHKPLEGLLCCSLLGALYLYPASSYWVVMEDAWAGPLIGWAALFYLSGRVKSSAGVAALAVVIRLVCIPFVMSGLLCSLVRRQSKARIASWAVSTLVVVVAYWLHFEWSRRNGFFTQKQVGTRLHGSVVSALQAVRCGTVMWAGRDLVSYLLVGMTWLGGFLRSPRGPQGSPAPDPDAGFFLALGAAAMFTALSIFGVTDVSQFYGFNLHAILVVGGVSAFRHLEAAG